MSSSTEARVGVGPRIATEARAGAGAADLTPSPMSAQAHRDAAAMRDHWWYRGRAAAVASLLRRAGAPLGMVLDYGCGTGHMGPVLARYGPVYGADDAAAALSAGHYAGYAWVGGPEQLDRTVRFGLVACLDVLEHVAGDAELLRELAGLLAPRGMLVVSVPMRPELFCQIDTVAGHLRRYTPAALTELWRRAGLTPVAGSGYVVSLLPLAAVHRRRIMRGKATAADEYGTPAAPLNMVLGAVACAEGTLARAVALPPGLSQITVLRRAA